MSDPRDVVDNTQREDSDARAGTYNPNTGHQTQRYDDDYRRSSDRDGKHHWTDERKGRSEQSRHIEPYDSRD